MAQNLRKYFVEDLVIDIISREPDRNIDYSEYYDNVWICKNDSFLSNIPKVRYVYNLLYMRPFVKSKIHHRYDICHIQYLHAKYMICFDIIRKHCKKIIVSFWGNDLYNSNFIDQVIKKKMINKADVITFSNPQMKKDFNKCYSRKNNIHIIGYSTDVIDEIIDNSMTKIEAKEYFGISSNSITITCGYTPKKEQQQSRILNSLNKIRSELPENVFLLLPMTYNGYEGNIDKVENYCKVYNFQCKIFKTFLSNNETAILRKASDIMIMVALNDQFSLTLQEYIFTENIIITGDWLPYEKLDEMGIFLYKIRNIENVGYKLLEIINERHNMNNLLSNNRKIIQKFIRNHSSFISWKNLYSQLLNS